jgi:hypothetical protein
MGYLVLVFVTLQILVGLNELHKKRITYITWLVTGISFSVISCSIYLEDGLRWRFYMMVIASLFFLIKSGIKFTKENHEKYTE